ncbi:hypothetical protein E2C01_065075 [Portunus trituberculatus]|uniref:Uncharacterized protein n=1 Tax=Portunus trituberculatus TaxID=210409 RepID=A0A5B7HLJ7_PORTR|nr:hypothetical protein [Portunus trituberculatus]
MKKKEETGSFALISQQHHHPLPPRKNRVNCASRLSRDTALTTPLPRSPVQGNSSPVPPLLELLCLPLCPGNIAERKFATTSSRDGSGRRHAALHLSGQAWAARYTPRRHPGKVPLLHCPRSSPNPGRVR